ncbi:Angio-associated migratory cell protein [Trichuris trichiura]|uniref:Angio-associated migratory cell protein n=1 Tax=Trichuris trichiura TaxID=36087 RepID=A0A077Z636_TRITR|nr:Angio-associated migratory cell protein [Trichuris trichiura]
MHLRAPSDDEFLQDEAGEDNEVVYLNDDEVLVSESSDQDGGGDSCEDEMRDDSSVTFAMHADVVLSIAIKGNLVISGSGDTGAVVWNAQDGDVVATLEGHDDSVSEVHLNYNEVYLATGDMSGAVIVWETVQWEKRFMLESLDDTNLEMTWMFWHHSTNVIFRGFATGLIAMNASNGCNVKYFQGDDSECTCGKLLADGVRLIAGYKNGLLRIWNLREATFVVVPGSEEIFCVDVLDDRIGAKGTSNGTFALFNVGDGAVYSTFSISQFTDTSREFGYVETVAFDPTKSLLSVSGINCPLIFFDMQYSRARAVFADIDGVSKALWLNNFLLTAGIDGSVHLLDRQTLEHKTEWHGHKSPICALAVNVDRHFVVTGDEDGVCKVFRLPLTLTSTFER